MEMWKKSTKEKSRKKQRKNDDEDEDGNVIGEVLSEWTKENFPSPIRAAATNEHWERERNDDDEDDDDDDYNDYDDYDSGEGVVKLLGVEWHQIQWNSWLVFNIMIMLFDENDEGLFLCWWQWWW